MGLLVREMNQAICKESCYNWRMGQKETFTSWPTNPETTPKIEIPTDLRYVKLRNWSDFLEKHATELFRTEDVAIALRTPEPTSIHVDYDEFVSAVMQRIDEAGCVHAWDMLTGEEHTTEPIPIHDLSDANQEQRVQTEKMCAQELMHTVHSIISMRSAYYGVEIQPEVIAAHLEGFAAQRLAPYRSDLDFLQETVGLLKRAQEDGILTIVSWGGM